MLPPAPWALVLCWWSLELETKSKCALRCGEGGWGKKRPCVHWHQNPTFRQIARDTPRAHLSKGTQLASGSYICESETLLQDQPQCVFVQESSAFWFPPSLLLAIRTRRV